jgi:MoxR-like ATPase
MVIATQNPIEFSGTFPLPEAQLDRFFMRVSLGYPKLEAETRIMQMNCGEDPLEKITAKIDEATLIKLQHAVTKIQIDPKIVDYIAALVHATRLNKKIRLGVSPRGSIALMKAAQASALLNDEGFVTPQRVQELVVPVLAHRMLLRSNNEKDHTILQEIIDATAVPAMPGAKHDSQKTETVFELAE